jgi:3-(3-hydroxy-phenyl)propionate hydroxylase
MSERGSRGTVEGADSREEILDAAERLISEQGFGSMRMAHLMPVWMGQGWNSGMRDATNLAWKLASVIAGQASERLLDTYDVERRGHAKAMVDLSMTFGTIIKPTDRRITTVRDAVSRILNLSPQMKSYFTDMRFKPMPRYSAGVVVEADTLMAGRAAAKRTSRFVTVRNAVDKRSPVGVQFIQPRVTTRDAAGVRLDDAIGPWWTIAAWGNDPARLFSAEDRTKARAIGGRFAAFMSETQRPWAEQEFADSGTLVVGDVDGSLKSWFDTRGVGVVFLRPDRFVAAVCLAQVAPQALDALLAAMSALPANARASAADSS